MDTLERAIRSALEKGDFSDRAYREKVYQSAFAALERALNNPNVSEDSAQARRTGLQQTIARVEGEHLAATRPAPVPMPDEARVEPEAPRAEPRIEPGPDRRSEAPRVVEPELRAEPRYPQPTRSQTPRSQAPRSQAPHSQPPRSPAERREPVMSAEPDAPQLDEYGIDADLDETVRGETRKTRRKRRPFALLFVIITGLAVLAVAAWWVVGSGIFIPADQRDGSVPNPSPVREAEDFNPAAGSPPTNSSAPRLGAEANDPDAIPLFTPGDQDDFSTPSDAVAELTGEGANRALRIHSGQSGSAILFNVPQDVLRQLAGRRALFVVEGQAEEGETTQISISCSFGELGDCGGRRRFDLTGERGDVIFDVDLPTVEPGSDGTIAIVSDVSNSNKAVDIFSIRVSAN
ncbi:hypothetical protein JYU29_13995 [Tianweitania sp. BSSL-BM11]|uniref:Uncharacterized protein n=1 Tax=Tianweitania aestuarii TaxID=2814886 RepID=A0ABS5RXP6_9HYPH|nr:hypothetical protein [Tianweitania aestuarii]MBS9721798.1 hypothetical protein [Tianweitania aestuarii]